MGTPRQAVVLTNTPAGNQARLLTLQLTNEAPFEVKGGEYIIVHTGEQNELGKPVKRPYSIVGYDAAHRELQLLLLPLAQGKGKGSRWVAALAPEAVISFSGPWGKKALPEADAQVGFVCTDTGLTGLCGWASGAANEPWRPRTRALWLHHSADGFASTAWALEKLAPLVPDLTLREIPPVDSPEREAVALDHVLSWAAGRDASRPLHMCLAGDGKLLRAAQQAMQKHSVNAEAWVVEAFFNKPPKESSRA